MRLVSQRGPRALVEFEEKVMRRTSGNNVHMLFTVEGKKTTASSEWIPFDLGVMSVPPQLSVNLLTVLPALQARLARLRLVVCLSNKSLDQHV